MCETSLEELALGSPMGRSKVLGKISASSQVPPIREISPPGRLQLSALWPGYVPRQWLGWLRFGEPPNATESPLSALQAAARVMHVAEIPSASSSCAFA